MTVVIIGSGNTATVLGRRIAGSGHRIVQVFSRLEEHAALLAEELGCPHTTDWTEINREAEVYLVALSDDALPGLGEHLSLPGKLVLHTAGSVSRKVLLGVSGHSGVLYPLQSLRAAIRDLPEIPLLIDANDPADLERIQSFARTLSGRVALAGDATRLKLHLAAVLVNNFSNHLYTLAEAFCRNEGLDFELLLPLIREGAERLSRFPPGETQTGPAVRGDGETIGKHLYLLDNYKDIKELYRLFTIQIQDLHRGS